MWQPVGHVDVYPNGGKTQPGCTLLEEMLSVFTCAHLRAIDLGLSAVNTPHPWRGYKCPSYEYFLSGLCLYCPFGDSETKNCNGMGPVASKKPIDGSVNNQYFLVTGSEAPYHRNILSRFLYFFFHYSTFLC